MRNPLRSAGRCAAFASTVALIASLAGCGDGSAQPGAPPAAAEPASSAPAWERLDPAPAAPDGVQLLTIGERLLLYGGCAHDYRDQGGCGASRKAWIFDPASGDWTATPASPAGVRGSGVWTGSEAIFPVSGLAYDPETESWRRLASAPIERRGGASVWTGSEVIVWGGRNRRFANERDGAAYDPATGTWRQIAPAPIALNLFDLVWTGNEAIAFGAELDGRNVADSRRAIGAAYDPESDTWRRLPRSRLSPQASTATWLDGRMVAYDYGGRSQTYDPESNRWSDPVRMPIEPSECYPDSVAAAGYVVAFYCGEIAVTDPVAGGWARVDGGLTERLHDSVPVWRFSVLAATDDAVYLLAEGITFGPSGIAQYNLPEAPHSFWKLRPDAAAASPGELTRCAAPEHPHNRVRVSGISCAQAIGLAFGVPGGHAVRIAPHAPGTVERIRGGFVCRYRLVGDRGPGGAKRGPLEINCIDRAGDRQDRQLRFVMP